MHQPPLILVVDDQADFLEIFSAKLQAAGFTVQVAHDGLSGIALAKAEIPDLILLDMHMPGISGADTILKMREESTLKDAKVVFLSGIGAQEEVAQGVNEKFSKDVGAAGYIKKTDDLDLIVAEVRKFI